MDQIFRLQQFFQDLTNWFMILIPVVGGAMTMYHYLMKNTSQDEQMATQHARSIRNVLLGTGAGMGMSAVVKLLVTYVAH